MLPHEIPGRMWTTLFSFFASESLTIATAKEKAETEVLILMPSQVWQLASCAHPARLRTGLKFNWP